jgi:DNA-binding CsgD family transcriptional regulator
MPASAVLGRGRPHANRPDEGDHPTETRSGEIDVLSIGRAGPRTGGPWTGELERTIQALVRTLARGIPPGGPVRLSDDHRSAVLLDLEVDGVRCVLLRPTQETTQLALSPREQEIARMVARGYPNKTIAAVLDISTWTVSTHLRRMFAKLGVTSRAAMVARSLNTRDDDRGGFPR